MTGWVGNVEEATLENTNFRTVLFTGAKIQLTVMRLAPGEEIGVEMHDHLDQFLRIEQGSARVTFGPSAEQIDEEHEVEDDWAVVVPGGTWHNVINTGAGELKLYRSMPRRNIPTAPSTVRRRKPTLRSTDA